MTTPRPNRWSITIGGTLPRREPGMLTVFAISAYALSRLGFRSANGTSTVIFTRVGLNCSTVLGTNDSWFGCSWGEREPVGPETGSPRAQPILRGPGGAAKRPPPDRDWTEGAG